MNKPENINYYFASLLLSFLLCLFVCGCINLSGLKQTQHPVRYYICEYPAPSSPAITDEIIHLRRFQTVGVFNTDRLVIQTGPFTTEYDYYNRWVVKPATMISDLLFRDLSSSGLFKAVLAAPGHLLPGHELTGTLEALQAIKKPDGWEVELVLNILFYPYPDNNNQPKIEQIFQRRYQKRLACPNGRPDSIVNALSECMKQLSASIQTDLAACL